MTISLDVVIKALKDVYRKTEADPYIIKPMAAALYKVWKNVDEQEDPRMRIKVPEEAEKSTNRKGR